MVSSNPSTNVAPDKTSSGLSMRSEVAPVVRRWLAGGIDAQILHSSVRVREFEEYLGGLKSPVVGKLSINVNAVIKQGSDELPLHKLLMNDINLRFKRSTSRRLQAAMFPTVVAVEKLPDLPADRNFLMIQEALDDYDSVQTLLYKGGKSSLIAMDAVRKALPALEFLHTISQTSGESLDELPRLSDPFTGRISNRLSKLRGEFDWLDSAFKSGCRVNGRQLPPLGVLLKAIGSWYGTGLRLSDCRLVHGDPHIENLLTRKDGRGQYVRWIDPNPLVGFSDPAYDWGKMLHFVEPVGAAKTSPSYVTTQVSSRGRQPTITAKVVGLSPRIETVRNEMQQYITSAALRALASRPEPNALLSLAIASAHVGFAALAVDTSVSFTKRKAAIQQKRFGLAFTLDALARCYEELDLDS